MILGQSIIGATAQIVLNSIAGRMITGGPIRRRSIADSTISEKRGTPQMFRNRLDIGAMMEVRSEETFAGTLVMLRIIATIAGLIDSRTIAEVRVDSIMSQIKAVAGGIKSVAMRNR